MSVKIRLSRIGKKHEPFYRVIAVDGRKKRDGAYLQDIGTYDVVKGSIVRFDEVAYQDWISKGAQPTDSAEKIFRMFKKIGLGVKLEAPKATAKKVVAQEPETQEKPATEEVQ